MDAKEFNELLNLQNYDKAARREFSEYCLKRIKSRIRFKNGPKDLESISHSVLLKFLKNLPKHYVFAPVKYLNKCVDNYLSTYKKENSSVELIEDIPYEQRFPDLEESETLRNLCRYLDKLNAYIFYAHAVEKAKEYEIAEILGLDLSYEAIRQRISRSKKLLKEILTDYVTKNHLIKS